MGDIAQAVGRPSHGARAQATAQQERNWWEQNRAGRVSRIYDGYYHLWNFAIDKSDLTKEHELAIFGEIKETIENAMVDDPRAYVTILGYASTTGPDWVNLQLSEDRSGNAADAVRSLDSVERIEAQYPLDLEYWREMTPPASSPGERAARDRRVEVLVQYVRRRVPLPPADVFVPEEEAERDQTSGVGRAGKFAWEYKGPAVPLGKVTMYGVLIFSGTFTIDTPEMAGTVELKNLNPKKIKVKAHDTLGMSETIHASVSEMGVDLSKYHFGLVYRPEFDPIPPPFPMIKVHLPAVSLEPFSIVRDDGSTVRFKGAMAVKVYMVASAAFKTELLARSGSFLAKVGSGSAALGTASLAGGVAGTLALLIGASQLVEAAREAGHEQGMMAYLASGFALRIAAAASTYPQEHNRAVFLLEKMSKDSAEGYVQAHEGWLAAEALVPDVVAQRAAIHAKHGASVEEVVDNIRAMISAQDSWGPGTSLPGSIQELL